MVAKPFARAALDRTRFLRSFSVGACPPKKQNFIRINYNLWYYPTVFCRGGVSPPACTTSNPYKREGGPLPYGLWVSFCSHKLLFTIILYFRIATEEATVILGIKQIKRFKKALGIERCIKIKIEHILKILTGNGTALNF